MSCWFCRDMEILRNRLFPVVAECSAHPSSRIRVRPKDGTVRLLEQQTSAMERDVQTIGDGPALARSSLGRQPSDGKWRRDSVGFWNSRTYRWPKSIRRRWLSVAHPLLSTGGGTAPAPHTERGLGESDLVRSRELQAILRRRRLDGDQLRAASRLTRAAKPGNKQTACPPATERYERLPSAFCR